MNRRGDQHAEPHHTGGHSEDSYSKRHTPCFYPRFHRPGKATPGRLQLNSTNCSTTPKEPVVRDKLAPTWSRHLGKLKHAAAFECIQHRLAEKFPGNFSIEPRLRQDQLTKEVLRTDRWEGSLLPDFVVHFTRNITRIQCVYDLKFPCGYAVGSYPWSREVVAQMKSYGNLGGECPPALVTPQRGVIRQ